MNFFLDTSQHHIPSFTEELLHPKFYIRYFVLAGRYLFRYADEFGDTPKGTPVPVDACTFRLDDEVLGFMGGKDQKGK